MINSSSFYMYLISPHFDIRLLKRTQWIIYMTSDRSLFKCNIFVRITFSEFNLKKELFEKHPRFNLINNFLLKMHANKSKPVSNNTHKASFTLIYIHFLFLSINFIHVLSNTILQPLWIHERIRNISFCITIM
jgi:hypothetical protein